MKKGLCVCMCGWMGLCVCMCEWMGLCVCMCGWMGLCVCMCEWLAAVWVVGCSVDVQSLIWKGTARQIKHISW